MSSVSSHRLQGLPVMPQTGSFSPAFQRWLDSLVQQVNDNAAEIATLKADLAALDARVTALEP